ncbi:unnamed protein product [Caenorhabditis bovis]|uniref:Uncharacterized protein n=1 Tax=Caenorhabditis bovis TaxID=2654633 RepID=A0A8S1F3D4_9PELO|nr:unnamed protein product [Caenorhabditis bovis]
MASWTPITDYQINTKLYYASGLAENDWLRLKGYTPPDCVTFPIYMHNKADNIFLYMNHQVNRNFTSFNYHITKWVECHRMGLILKLGANFDYKFKRHKKFIEFFTDDVSTYNFTIVTDSKLNYLRIPTNSCINVTSIYMHCDCRSINADVSVIKGCLNI